MASTVELRDIFDLPICSFNQDLPSLSVMPILIFVLQTTLPLLSNTGSTIIVWSGFNSLLVRMALISSQFEIVSRVQIITSATSWMGAGPNASSRVWNDILACKSGWMELIMSFFLSAHEAILRSFLDARISLVIHTSVHGIL